MVTVQTSRPPLEAVPITLRDSLLMRKGGYELLRNLPGAETRSRLLDEASRQLPAAKASEVTAPDHEEFRGGRPARRFLSAGGGLVQTAFYHDPTFIGFLEKLCNGPVRPTGNAGTYTYYARPADHLDLHRDILTCDLAVVTCLLDKHNPASRGGLSVLYPTRQAERLSAIRTNPGFGAIEIRMGAGQTLVMLGGLVPHAITPIEAGELRIVSLLCYRVLS